MCTPDAVETRAKAGFSLVELIMAIFVLAFGVLGLATTTLFVTRQLTLSEVTTARAVAIQSVMGAHPLNPLQLYQRGGRYHRANRGLLDCDRQYGADHRRPHRDGGSGSGLLIRGSADPHVIQRRRGHFDV